MFYSFQNALLDLLGETVPIDGNISQNKEPNKSSTNNQDLLDLLGDLDVTIQTPIPNQDLTNPTSEAHNLNNNNLFLNSSNPSSSRFLVDGLLNSQPANSGNFSF